MVHKVLFKVGFWPFFPGLYCLEISQVIFLTFIYLQFPRKDFFLQHWYIWWRQHFWKMTKFFRQKSLIFIKNTKFNIFSTNKDMSFEIFTVGWHWGKGNLQTKFTRWPHILIMERQFRKTNNFNSFC